MRVKFKDGSVVEHVAASQSEVVGEKIILKTSEGDVVAELVEVDVQSCELIV